MIHPYPVSFFRHFLIPSVNRKSPLIRAQTIAKNRACAYLSHCVVLHSNFPKEEIDEVSIIDCLDKVRLCRKQRKKKENLSQSDVLPWQNSSDTYFTANWSNICHIMQKISDGETWAHQSIIFYFSTTICIWEKTVISIEMTAWTCACFIQGAVQFQLEDYDKINLRQAERVALA